MAVQDRTQEFRSCVTTATRRLPTASASRNNLLSGASVPLLANDGEKKRFSRGEFARQAADIGKKITATTGKLERLALLAKRRTLFDDRPVEIAELTYIIKQDLSAINQSISALQTLNRSNPPAQQQVGEHSKNVVVMLQGKLADVSVGFREVLEVRTKNIQKGRERTENFVSCVKGGLNDQAQGLSKSHSPLYATPSRTPLPQSDLLSLEPSIEQQQQQALLLEEQPSDQSYLNSRSDAIAAIESTIHELGGIFAQLAEMVSQQTEMIQRIDANTEDVVSNVSGAQRELLKYWGRVSSNRWLVVKMFGILMIFFLLWVLVS
ncbi:cis-Golgi t-SNARE syntaxin [Orbilia oligospora]|uniref:Cis-Golgi t-SNARE syntaxin n=1 Tax=Orbilia oligospora TaxID=2813651 RepID=A0A7C8K991_ORBOL|nr:cis-Golgi t-SNARE syntaxin [Orbilia oligospora]KAF3183176.1 cis-Golgi t-SNARE syntaxin [Orbilia oligospora]KAF3238870.1 cis-Golgi t-SNARE syntaxin [Orbilia oligospora]KAF3251176.1 cis-Golgi t-SNARE syntaxin [Orbilia oligospora]KAF3285169.1 cis-Golgi t-SNARE syntaxin [Orbilia oligospora]